jgi:hypothetical protein
MPRSQTYDPSFSMDLGDGRHYMNPQTMEVFDSSTNTAYASPDELGMSVQSQMQSQGGEPRSSSGGGMGQTASNLGSLASTGYGAYSAYTGGSAASAAAAAYGGGSAASGGTGALLAGNSAGGALAGQGAGAGMMPGMGAVAWPLAIVASAVMAGKNYHDRSKESGNAMSMEDMSTLTHMWGVPKPLRGIQSKLDKIPGSPTWIANQLFGASRQRQEKGARKVSRSGAFRDAGLIGAEDGAGYGLADGSEFSISDYKTNTGKDAYNINFDGSENADGISFLNAISSGILGEKSRKGSDVKDSKTSSDLTGELYNAAMSNGDFAGNIRHMGDKVGGRDAIYSAVGEQWRNNQIDAAKRDAYFAAIDKQYGIANPTGGRWEDGANLTAGNLKRNKEQLAKANKIPKAPTSTTKPLPMDNNSIAAMAQGMIPRGDPGPMTGGGNTSSSNGLQNLYTQLKPQQSTMEGNRNGGRPAPVATFRPGADVNFRVKNGSLADKMRGPVSYSNLSPNRSPLRNSFSIPSNKVPNNPQRMLTDKFSNMPPLRNNSVRTNNKIPKKK